MGFNFYEPDELPTALSRDVDSKDTTSIGITPNAW
jgi:hypothetical protein